MGHVCCIGMIMGLCLVFYVFFCKAVDVVEGISLRAGPAVLMEVSAMSEKVVSDFFSKDDGMFITNKNGMGLYFEEVDGRW